MSTKSLDASQVQQLNRFTNPFICDGECSAEAAIRRIEELEAEVARLTRLSGIHTRCGPGIRRPLNMDDVVFF